MKKKTKTEIVTIGNIGVDAGLCWIGDPCYVLHKGKDAPNSIGRDWGEFCEKIGNSRLGKSFTYDLGHEGLGVCVGTGFGDGFYPVKAVIEDHGENGGKRVMGVFVDFGSSAAVFAKLMGRKPKATDKDKEKVAKDVMDSMTLALKPYIGKTISRSLIRDVENTVSDAVTNNLF